MPITHVDSSLDQLESYVDVKKMNGVSRGAYEHYNAKQMKGLPVGIQIVGQRLQEEKVLAYMQAVESALEEHSNVYKPLSME